MGYLDNKKKSKKKDTTEHVAMTQAGGQPKAHPAGANQFSGPKNIVGRRKGDR